MKQTLQRMKSITLVTCVLIVLRVQEQTSVGRIKV
jgi:hypothetical protein